MSESTQLLEVLEEIGSVQGVRGAFIALSDRAYAQGKHSGLTAAVANEVAKTVRRMTVASATVGLPLEEMIINFGAARMLIVPLREESTLLVVLERDAAVDAVRSLVRVQAAEVVRMLQLELKVEAPPASETSHTDDEVARLMNGELGPILHEIERRFASYIRASERHEQDPASLMNEQVREWLLCCSPSAYTFPLLLDGLAQLLSDTPELRTRFVHEVGQVVQDAKVWNEPSLR